MKTIERLTILFAALGLLLGTAGCPTTDDDDSAGDDDAADDDAADDDASDDDASDDDGGGTDADGDGFTDEVDCDDGDPDVNPGATEFCYDDVDNNCDGDVDEADADDCAVNDEEIVVEGGGATLTIPVGAVMGDVTVTIEEIADPRLPGDCTFLTVFFAVMPLEIVFQIGAEVKLPEYFAPSMREVVLYRFDGSDFVFVTNQVPLISGFYEANIDAAGIYVVADCPAAP